MSISKRISMAMGIAFFLAAMCPNARGGEGNDFLPSTQPTATITAVPVTVSHGNLLNVANDELADLKTLNITLNSEKVKATYLGVETTAADETLRAQLKLPAGVGLAIRHVEGPAKDAGVLQHDVLYKINEQLMVNSEQLRVLVRTFKPGDKVELTLIREAQQVKLTATLVEKEVEALSAPNSYQLYNAPADEKALRYFNFRAQPQPMK